MGNRPLSGDRPRLLLLIPELLTGGAARVARNQADALSAHFEVDEAVFTEAFGMDFAGANKIFSLDQDPPRGVFRPVSNLVKRARRLRKLKRDQLTDLTISHLDGAHRVSILSGGRDAKVLVVHGSLLHDESLRGARGFITRRLLVPLLYNRADRVVTVSRDLIDELVGLGVEPAKISAISNVIDVEAIEASAQAPLPEQERALFGSGPVLLSTGRLHPQKNPLRLLELFAALSRKRKARLVMIGDGPLRDQAVELSERLGLETYAAWRDQPLEPGHRVYFLGSRANPFPYVAAADLFLMPSLWEGFPLGLCEALACGVPAISADCPTGPREILAPATRGSQIREPELAEFGMLMPLLKGSANMEVWVRGITRLIDDPVERSRLSGAGKNRVRDFSAERIMPQWIQLLNALLADRERLPVAWS